MKHSSKASITFTAREWCLIANSLRDAARQYEKEETLPITRREIDDVTGKIYAALEGRGYFKNLKL